MKKYIAFIIAVIFIVTCCVACTSSTETIGKAETLYTLNEEGTQVENIPYENYIQTQETPDDAIIPEIYESASGEENSTAIQNVIDALSASGGGIVYIPDGEYKVTTIWLKSNITFFVSNGAKLISLSYEENSLSSSPLNTAVLYCDGVSDVLITGGGTINGCGTSYTTEAETDEPLYALKEFNLYTRVIEARKRIRFGIDDADRCNVLQINNSDNVTVDNIILQESAGWTFVINNSKNVTVQNMVIDNNVHVSNSDGIDICSGSNNIQISNCFIATGDDGIVLKPSSDQLSDITVENCEIFSLANCFKIGTETQYDVTNVSVNDCYFFIPDGIVGGYAGIAIESADGSNIKDITVQNITMDGISAPLLIWLGDRLQYDTTQQVGSISDVLIANITATNTEMPSAVTGCQHDSEVYYVENVTLYNINVTYRDTGEDLNIADPVHEYSMDGYPEITRVSHIYIISHELSKYWDLPCYGILVRHTKNVDYTDYTATPRSCNEREMYYLSDVN